MEESIYTNFLLKVLIGITALTVAHSSLANQDASGFIGFDLGKSSSNYFDDVFKSAANERSSNSISVAGSADTSTSASRLFVGMQSQNAGLQLSYVNFGTYKYAVSASNGYAAAEVGGEIDTYGVYVDLILQIPIGEDVGKFFFELGAGRAFMELDNSSDRDKGSSLHIGAGIKIALNKSLDIQAGAHKYLIKTEDGESIFATDYSYNLLSAGLTLHY